MDAHFTSLVLPLSMIRKLLIIPLLYFLVIILFICFQRRLLYHPSPLDSRTPSDYSIPYEDVHFRSKDGLMLNGWLIRHQSDSKQHPFIFYCHGNGANLSMLAEISSIFFNYGWDVLVFDYRSYGASEVGELSEELVISDAQAAYDFAMNLGFVEANTIIWGHSLGAAVAARVASQNKPAALILEGSFTSVFDVARQQYPWLLILPEFIRDRFETINYLKGRAYPVLLIHGEEDEVIPFALGRKNYESATDPKEWLPIPKMGHANFPSFHKDYQNRLKSFVTSAISSYSERSSDNPLKTIIK